MLLLVVPVLPFTSQCYVTMMSQLEQFFYLPLAMLSTVKLGMTSSCHFASSSRLK